MELEYLPREMESSNPSPLFHVKLKLVHVFVDFQIELTSKKRTWFVQNQDTVFDWCDEHLVGLEFG